MSEQYLPDCIFCKIAQHELSASIRFEDDEIIAFDDANPQAPIHILVIPKIHLISLTHAESNHQELLGKLLYRCKILAKELNIADSGYRAIINVGKWGGQIVPHLHIHILGGAPLTDKFKVATADKSVSLTKGTSEI